MVIYLSLDNVCALLTSVLIAGLYLKTSQLLDEMLIYSVQKTEISSEDTKLLKDNATQYLKIPFQPHPQNLNCTFFKIVR